MAVYSSALQWNGGRVTRAVGIGAQRGTTRAAEYLKSISVPKAPLDRGPLRASAKVIPATPYKAEAILLFDEPYAAIQHENLEYHHDDGQAKYVEQPMVANQRKIQGIIAQDIAEAINDA